MEAISLKLEESILTEIDEKLARHRFSTRTEFIRDAIRKSLSEMEKEELIRAVGRLKGSSKRKTSDADLHKAREIAFELLDKRKSR